MKKSKSLLRLTVLLLLGGFLGLQVYNWNARNLTGNAVPMPFGFGASVVLSGSMEPAMSVGDLLIVQEQKAYETGDVVIYQSGRTPVVHRIVAMDADTVITRGDANNAADTPFQTEMIKGKVILTIPLLGYVFLALKTPLGTVSLIAAALLLMELSFRNERKEKDAQQEEIKDEIRRLMLELEDKEF